MEIVQAYVSSLRNNVRSRAWGAAIGCSYRVERCCIVKVGNKISYICFILFLYALSVDCHVTVLLVLYFHWELHEFYDVGLMGQESPLFHMTS